MRLFQKKAVPHPADAPSGASTPSTGDPDSSATGEPAAAEPDPEVIELTPGEVALPLATKLAAIDQAELTAAKRDLASPGGTGLLEKLHSMAGAVWVLGPVEKPLGWTSLELLPDTGAIATVGVVRGTVLPVLPGQRDYAETRQLLADALLAQARAWRLAELRATVFTESAAEAFLTGAGWVPRDSPDYVIRRLDLGPTAERRFRIVEDARQFAAGYVVVRVDRLAEEHDQPEGAERFRVVARLGSAEVGSTEMTVYDEMPEFALEGDTYVVPEHRGHRLGLLMRAEIIRWVEADRSRVRVVQTRTPVDDTYTLAQLDRLGARGAGLRRDLRRDLLLEL